jgi:signal transduction histidine kinase
LGLSISKKLIEGHGGSLNIDTNEENTTFVIDLPFNQEFK